MLRIQVLGLTRAWVDGEPADLGPAGQRAVLGLLILAGGQPVSRAALVHSLWDDEPPDSAVNVLQTRVKHLRRALEPDRPARQVSAVIPLAGDGYRFAGAPGGVDLAEFRRLVRQAGQDHDDRRLDAALRVWPHGEPFADVPALGRHPAVVALGEERRSVLTRYAAVMLADGTPGGPSGCSPRRPPRGHSTRPGRRGSSTPCVRRADGPRRSRHITRYGHDWPRNSAWIRGRS
ncbi:hypothetical protein Q0Z83_109580 [Actinoplanes sichuanensis]|nr:hypothetical protein Q0Z83_109580 [Actinoplanes sichuanensis]